MIDIIFSILTGLFGLSMGATMADIDLAPPLPVRHRSAWTHGPIFPALAWGIAYLYPGATAFAIGFSVAFALHLVKDMFPKRWHGGAKISWYPLGGWRMNGVLSFAFLALSAGISCWLAWQLAEPELANAYTHVSNVIEYANYRLSLH